MAREIPRGSSPRGARKGTAQSRKSAGPVHARREPGRPTGTGKGLANPSPRGKRHDAPRAGLVRLSREARSSEDPADGAAIRRKMIETAAYYRAEKRGFAPGGEMDDWIQAEREIDTLFR